LNDMRFPHMPVGCIASYMETYPLPLIGAIHDGSAVNDPPALDWRRAVRVIIVAVGKGRVATIREPGGHLFGSAAP
jgi:hypothetical protein